MEDALTIVISGSSSRVDAVIIHTVVVHLLGDIVNVLPGDKDRSGVRAQGQIWKITAAATIYEGLHGCDRQCALACENILSTEQLSKGIRWVEGVLGQRFVFPISILKGEKQPLSWISR